MQRGGRAHFNVDTQTHTQPRNALVDTNNHPFAHTNTVTHRLLFYKYVQVVLYECTGRICVEYIRDVNVLLYTLYIR